MHARLRLLLVTPEYPPHQGGGIARFYRALSPALTEIGCEVTVVVASPFSNEFSGYEHDGVRVRFVPGSAVDERARDMGHLSAAPMFRRWLAAARAAHETARELGPFDLVEVTDFGLMFAPFLAEDRTCPVVVQCHGSFGQIAGHEPRRPSQDLDVALMRLAEAVLLPRADDVQTCSTMNAGEWYTRLGQRVRVLPPALPIEEPQQSRTGDALVIGRIQSWKGPEILCQALQRMSGDHGPRFTWIGRDTDTAPGGGSLAAWLRKTYPDVWGTRIATPGQFGYAEVSALRRHARVIVVPSSWDVFNFTTVEAMASRSVVVCSDGAGASELIESGKSGFVFSAGDPAALADTLADALARTPEEMEAIGRRAGETVATRLDPATVARARVAVYRDVVAGAIPRRAAVDWVREFFEGLERDSVSTAFLDQFAIADLSRYLKRRASDRVTAGLRGVVSR